MREAGFAVGDLYYADFFGYFATMAFKRLGNTMSNENFFLAARIRQLQFPVGRVIERCVRDPVGKNIVGVAKA